MGSKLEDLLQERSEAYSRYSDEILELISDNVIPALLHMMELNDQELDKLEWNNVAVRENQLVVTGVIKYKAGDIVSDGETTVQLDEQMALLLDKVVRAAVPLELAANGTSTDILEHLEESARRLKEEYEAVYGHEPKSYQHAMQTAMNNQLGMDFGPDFDYNELTDEQKESFYLWGMSEQTKGKPN